MERKNELAANAAAVRGLFGLGPGTVLFVVLTFAISAISYAVMVRTGTGHKVGFFWMWSPGIAGLIAARITGRRFRDLGLQPGPGKYLLLGFLIPLVYSLSMYAFFWITGWVGFQAPSMNLVLFSIPGLFFACAAALGEELGWRGFLVPTALPHLGYHKTILLSWIIWSLWHYPAIIWGDYHSAAPLGFDLSSLTVTILGLSALTAWLRVKSGSVWPAVIWHGTHNLLVQGVFLAMTEESALSPYLVDDFGLGTVFIGIVLAVVFMRRPAKV